MSSNRESMLNDAIRRFRNNNNDFDIKKVVNKIQPDLFS